MYSLLFINKITIVLLFTLFLFLKSFGDSLSIEKSALHYRFYAPSISLNTVIYEKSDFLLNAENISLGKGELFYNGNLNLSDNDVAINENIDYTVNTEKLVSTISLFYNSNQYSYKKENSSKASASRNLSLSSSFLINIKNINDLFLGVSIGQNFLSENFINDNKSDRYMYYNEIDPFDPNISLNISAGYSRLFNKNSNYRFTALLGYYGNWIQPEIRINDGLIEYVKYLNYNLISFEKNEYNNNILYLQLALLGPKQKHKIYSLKDSHNKLINFSITNLNLKLFQVINNHYRSSLNYHFYDGVIDLSEFSGSKKYFGFSQEGNFDILIYNFFYTGLDFSTKILRNRDKTLYWNFDINHIYPFIGFRLSFHNKIKIDINSYFDFANSKDNFKKFNASLIFILN